MSVPSLSNVQPFLVAALRAYAALAAVAVPVIADDGSYPKLPQLEAALSPDAGRGLAIVVWQPESHGLSSKSKDGTFVHEIYIPIVIHENVEVNQGSGGTLIPVLLALEYVFNAVCGQRMDPFSISPFAAMDPPFNNFGKVNGVNKVLANISISLTGKTT